MYGIGIAVIVLVTYQISRQQNLIALLEKFNPRYLPLICLAALIHLGLIYYLWRSLLRYAGGIFTTERLVLHSFLGGKLLGLITPGQIGGLAKGMFFQQGVRENATSVSVLYSGYNQLVEIMLGFAGITFILVTTGEQMENRLYWPLLLTLTGIIILSGVILILLFKTELGGYLHRKLPDWFIRFKETFFTHLKAQRPGAVVRFTGIALVANLASFVEFHFFLNGFTDIPLSVNLLMAYEAAFLITYLLPIAPANLGIREGARVYLFSLVGVNKGIVLYASLMMYFLNIILPSLAGIPSLRYFWKNTDEKA